ncbi:hypothetical protein HMPREF1862_01693 [Varibaculum cambriense]|uniref:Uncharacterized protein n=1 Tax=Varibaculum cambriense TaxID=184870 RepID=A0AB34WXL1_9ACTO|nr:hypothetical protein HMPREF1862_01693 [Varibaculum cambriense]
MGERPGLSPNSWAGGKIPPSRLSASGQRTFLCPSQLVIGYR